jgi:hypothetical protein
MAGKQINKDPIYNTALLCVLSCSGIVVCCGRRRHRLRVNTATGAIKRVRIRRDRIPVYVRVRILATGESRQTVGRVGLWQLGLGRFLHVHFRELECGGRSVRGLYEA